MKLCFFGSAGEVGRSCIMVEALGKNFLFDAGVMLSDNVQEYPKVPKKIVRQLRAVFLTHAHFDHSGYLPFLVKQGFRGKIFCTKPTRDLLQLLLADALHIAKENKVKGYYSQKHIDKAMKLVEVVQFNQPLELAKNATAEFFHSGHILGSAQVLFSAEGKTLLYSSDLNTRGTYLLEGTKIPRQKVDFLVVESTYGCKNNLLPSLKSVSKAFADAVNNTFLVGGKVLVPVFAIGRGQELMLLLENYIRSGYIPQDTLVYVDGMVNSANKICRNNVAFLRPEILNRILLAGDDPFKSPFIRQPKTRNKSDVLSKQNVVILATSGMLSGGPSVGYLKALSGSGRNLVALVGYQVPGCLGARLVKGEKNIKVHGKKLRVNALVRQFRFGGHADFLGLFEYVRSVNSKKVFFVHGEGKCLKEFSSAVKKKLKKQVFVPKIGDCFRL